MAALIVRVIVVIFAFLLASFSAALVMTIALVIAEWDSEMMMSPSSAWIAVGLFGFALSNFGLLPAFLVILLAESFRIRSVFYYTVIGAFALLALYYWVGFSSYGPVGAPPFGHDVEIMAAAGIVAGFVYWAVAGRRAGAWQDRRAATPPSENRTPPARTDR